MKKLFPLKLKIIISNFLVDINNFGLVIAVNHVLYYLFYDCTCLPSLQKKVTRYRQNTVHNYLKRKYEAFIEQYSYLEEYKENKGDNEQAPIWVLWWQGIDQMPKLIKICYESQMRHSGNHPIIMISKHNVDKYVSVPQYIYDRVENGNMKFAHLADIIRVSLLAKHGGLWLDASVYCAKDIPEEIFAYNFYSCKKEKREVENISRNRWTTYIIGGKKNEKIFRFIRDFFLEYCRHNSIFIDYFLFDHIINLAYESFEDIRNEMNALQENNGACEELANVINQAFDPLLFTKIREDGTFLFKLRWQEKLLEETANNEKTFFYWLERDFENMREKKHEW